MQDDDQNQQQDDVQGLSNDQAQAGQDQNQSQSGQTDNTQKDPQEWKSGDDPATGAQKSYINTLEDTSGQKVGNVEDMNKAEASEKIDELRDKAGFSDSDKNNNG